MLAMLKSLLGRAGQIVDIGADDTVDAIAESMQTDLREIIEQYAAKLQQQQPSTPNSTPAARMDMDAAAQARPG